jgi:SAM-dependent methyltransferase
MTEYEAWAPYYDMVHQGLPGEAEFYVGQAVRLGGATLELGAGTGRIALPMAMSGVEVTALDNSPAMLALCAEKRDAIGPVSGSITLVEADMRDFDLGRTFDFIAMPYRAFMHLLTPGDQRRCMRCIRRHLAPKGCFILNTWAARPSSIAALAHQQHAPAVVGEYPLPDGGLLRHYHEARYDEYHQWIRERHTMEELDPEGALRCREELPLVRSWVTAHEMDHLANLCGYKAEAVFGDFDCNAFGPHSIEMIWVLRAGV